MKNLSIVRKFVLAFGITLVALLLVIALGLVSIFNVLGSYTAFYTTDYAITQDADTIAIDVNQGIGYLGVALSNDHGAEAQTMLQSGVSLLNSALDAAGALQTDLAAVADDSAVAELESQLRSLIQTVDQLMQYAQLGDTQSHAQAQQLYVDTCYPLAQEIIANLDEISSGIESQVSASYESTSRTNTVMVIVLCAVGLLALLLVLVCATRLTRDITRPVKELHAAINEITNHGNLHPEVHYQSGDELGELAENVRVMCRRVASYMDDITEGVTLMANGNLNVPHYDDFLGDFREVQTSLRKMVVSLNETVSSVKTSAEQVAAGADQVSSGAQAMAQGATEQASAVEELSASISEIDNGAKENAASAKHAREMVQQAGEQVQISHEKMIALKGAMEDILAGHQEISQIISTIENIAFQTNILALNAAVEAARAGASGKGFAVVADEVRNLASRSDEAAKQTKRLIEQSTQNVEKGNQLTEDVSASLDKTTEIAGAVQEYISNVVDSILASTDSIDQVTTGVDQISSVVQTNSATAEESAAASEQLSGQAQIMKDLVSRFSLIDQGDQTALPENGSVSGYHGDDTREPSGKLPQSAFDKY